MKTLAELFGGEMGEFKPCVVYFEGVRLTQMLLQDAAIVWVPWRGTSGMGHAVDLGYHMETGELIGIQIWDDVRASPQFVESVRKEQRR
jgi:hypothetical protein